MNVDLIRQYAELYNEKSRAEADLDAIKGKLAGLDRLVQDELIQNGVSKLPVETSEGPMTVYVWRILNARPGEGKERPDVVAALRSCGWGDLVKEDYNANTLSAAVREHLAGEEPLPAVLAGAIKVEEHTQARVTKATKAESMSERAIKNLKTQGA